MEPKNIESVLSDICGSIQETYELEYFLIHQNRYRYILRQITTVGLSTDARILDVGCYPLHLFAALNQLGYQVYGVSSRHESVAAPNVFTLNVETGALPFADNYFNVLLFSEVIEHLVTNPLVYLHEFKRVLKSGGRLILTTPNAAGLHKIIPILCGRTTYFSLPQLYKTLPGDDSIYYRHNREFTKNELAEILEQAGFTVTCQTYLGAYGPFRKKLVPEPLFKKGIKILAFSLTLIWARLRDSLYFEAVPSDCADSAKSSEPEINGGV